jgi:hypothetical protein
MFVLVLSAKAITPREQATALKKFREYFKN